MTFAIEPAEYRRRLAATRASMAERGIEVLLVGDIANQYWLTGCEGWSFYLPQLVIVTQSDPEPLWIGRAMDAPGAAMTGYMDASRVLSYPERYVHRPDRHPCDHIAAYLADRGLAKAAIGYEADAYYFTPKCVDVLKKGLPGARFVEADLLVNWLRAIKSEAEIGLIRNGARLVEKAMAAAYDLIRPGVRQCDVVRPGQRPRRHNGAKQSAATHDDFRTNPFGTAHRHATCLRFSQPDVLYDQSRRTR